MKFLHSKTSFISNDGGLIKYCMTFSLSNIINKPNKLIYVYKYNLRDLIEINYQNEMVITKNFDGFRPDLGKIIEESWAFFEGYFNSADLKNKRFIFDTTLKLPIRYSDFALADKNSLSSKETLFVTDNKRQGYVLDDINIFISIENTRQIDNCILAIFSELRNISKPINGVTSLGLQVSSIVAGLLAGVKSDELEKNINSVDCGPKFQFALNEINLDSTYVREMCSYIKTDKLYNKLFSVAHERNDSEFSGESVNVSRLATMGLNNFIKSIKDPKKKIRVNMDVNFGVKYMYILDGAAFVDLSLGYSLQGIQELFMSEEIYGISRVN